MRLSALMLIPACITSCSSLKTVLYTLDTPRIAAHTQIIIVHISDLHSTIHNNDQSTLIEKIKTARPDLIVLTGDIIDDVTPRTGAYLLLDGIRGIAPVYYVAGNHEYMSKDINGIRAELRFRGVQILSDEYKRLAIKGNDIVLAGVDDPVKKIFEDPSYNQQESLRTAFGGLTQLHGYKILLAHRPERINMYLEYPFDLILSGHTHGGQVRLPFINGLYAPNQGIFPRYGGGLYKHNETTHIISRGLSVMRFPPRIGNPPELVIITLRGL